MRNRAAGSLHDIPTEYRPRPVTRAASRRAVVARAAHDLEQLALILAAVHKPAERAACIRIASDLRAVL
jgi:hypothetical protein